MKAVRGAVIATLAAVVACGEDAARPDAAPASAPATRVPQPPGAFAPSMMAFVDEGGAAEPMRGGDLADVDTCATCHPAAAAQWSASAHSFASFGNPIYRANVELFRRILGRKASQHCGGCHDVPLQVDGEMHGDPSPDDLRSHTGVACRVCHGIKQVTSDGNGSYVLSRAPLPTPDVDDAASVEQHRVAVRVRALGAELCVACHRGFLSADLSMPVHLSGLDEPTFWRSSAWTGNGTGRIDKVEPQTCIDCHMPDEPAAADEMAARDGRLRSHRFLGGHTWMAGMRGDRDQLERLQARLRGVASIDVAAALLPAGTPGATGPEGAAGRWHLPADGAPVVPGQRVYLDVVVRNLLVGHRFPGGVLDMQDTWIEVEVRDAQGRAVASSGMRHAAGDGADSGADSASESGTASGSVPVSNSGSGSRSASDSVSRSASDSVSRSASDSVSRSDSDSRSDSRSGSGSGSGSDDAHVLRSLVVNADGAILEEHEMPHFRAVAANHTIGPRDAVAVRYALDVPSAALRLPLTVHARLRHRTRSLAIQRAVCTESRRPTGRAFLRGARGTRDLVLDPCAPQPITDIAETTVALGGVDEAVDRRGTAPRPAWERLYEHGMALTQVVTERLEEPRGVLAAALAHVPAGGARPRAMILAQLAWVAGKQGRADDALALVSEARTLLTSPAPPPASPSPAAARPPSPPVLDAIAADALARVWRWREAVAPARALVERAPRNAGAWAVLARVLASAGDDAGALDAAVHGLALTPRDADLLRTQATALAALARGASTSASDTAAAALAAYDRFRAPDAAAALRIACAARSPRCRREREPGHVHLLTPAPSRR